MIHDLFFYIFLGIWAVQMVYWVFLFFPWRVPPDNYSNRSHSPVSVIVSAHNELENLKKLIPALLNQNYPNYEIIIVNDRSWDGSFDFLEEQKKLIKNLKTVTVEDTPPKTDAKKYALTLGIKAAQHEHLLFTDADCVPASNNWILQMHSCFTQDSSIVIGISHYQPQKGLLNSLIRLETVYTAVQYVCFALRGMPYMAVGRNLAYKKSLFMENKGFHPFMFVRGGDDDLFVNKLANAKNTNVCLHTQGYTVSYPKTTWKEWLHQKMRHLSVGKFYKPKHKWILGLLHATHLGVYIGTILVVNTQEYFNFGLAAFFLRWFTIVVIFLLHAKNMRIKINVFQILFFDLFYVFYLLTIGVKGYSTKNISWR